MFDSTTSKLPAIPVIPVQVQVDEEDEEEETEVSPRRHQLHLEMRISRRHIRKSGSKTWMGR
jgi:hypothetical protein